MKRKDFLRTSAGFVAVIFLSGFYTIQNEKSRPRKIKFRDYQKDTSFGKVRIVTPNDGFYIHSFFDVCPFSPSQKYLAVNKIPYQNKHVSYGDTVDICIVDLENETIETVYSTKGWGYQLGANLNWGTTDRYLYTNDIINDQAVCVRIDLETKEVKGFAGPMYHLAPDESAVVGFPLDIINTTQMGYGVPQFRGKVTIEGAPANEGLWRTDLKKNKRELLVSLEQVAKNVDEPGFIKGGNFYFFHSKYNRQGTRIFQVARCLFPESTDLSKKGWNPMLFTFNSDGTDIHQSITRKQWSKRGNHPNWHPDGERIIMNLTPTWLGEDEMYYCMFHHEGKNFEILSKKHLGSGHPSINSDSSYLLVDYYVDEYKKLGYQECPVKLIDLKTDEAATICTVFTDLKIDDSTFRIDPHPVWSYDYQKVCFNGAPGGERQVFVADIEGLI